MSAAVIPLRELRSLPFITLCAIARAAARDVDRGDESKRDLVEKVFRAIRGEKR